MGPRVSEGAGKRNGTFNSSCLEICLEGYREHRNPLFMFHSVSERLPGRSLLQIFPIHKTPQLCLVEKTNTPKGLGTCQCLLGMRGKGKLLGQEQMNATVNHLRVFRTEHSEFAVYTGTKKKCLPNNGLEPPPNHLKAPLD